jgi:hypothetical protein
MRLATGFDQAILGQFDALALQVFLQCRFRVFADFCRIDAFDQLPVVKPASR